jgi:cell division protein FtsL
VSDDVEGEIDAGDSEFEGEPIFGAFGEFEIKYVDELDELEYLEADDDLEHDDRDEDDDDLEDDDDDADDVDGIGREVAKAGHPSMPRRAGWERPTRIAVGSLALIAIMFLFVFPTRSYLAQQRQVGAARNAVQELKTQNAQLERQKERLQEPSEIERLAREQFNMVLPNEQAYNVISTATTTTTKP